MDVYFKSEYGKVCEVIEKGTCEIFEFSSENGTVRNMFIKRAIPYKIEGKQYYDITTPYGYGGPIVVNGKGNTEQLIYEYDEAFTEYCFENDIVCEFVRFHPLYDNAPEFASVYEVKAIRKTVGTNLRVEDPVTSEFGKSCKKNIRRVLKAGVSYRITEKPESITDFIDIYYKTMSRDNAAEFYYFSREYFELVLELLRDNLVLVEAIFEEKVIAANLCFVSDGNIHIHLSGTLAEFLNLSPAYILRYAITLWGKEHGLGVIHHGGGISNAEDDSLYQFKKQFGKNTSFEFSIGQKIRNKKVYDELCYLSDNYNCDFFPAYRKR